MKANSRTAKYFDCIVDSYTPDRATRSTMSLPVKPLIDLLEHINTYNRTTPYYRENKSRTETWHIADYQVNSTQTKAVLLFNRSDRLAADQAVSDPAASQFVVNPKLGNQGNASSAHLAIRLTPVKPNVYLTVLEDATGISTRDIEAMLALIVRKSRTADNTFFRVNDPSGAQRIARYKFAFVGHPSDDFKAELESSTIQGIELADITARDQVFDEDGYTVEKRKVIHLKLRDKEYPIWDALISVGRRATEEHLNSLRVRFVDNHQSTYTVEMDASTMRLVNEDKYVKRVRLSDFVGRLNTASETINSEIRDKLFALI